MNDRQGRTGGIVAGSILVALGVIFLFRDWIDLDWGVVWPFFLIVPGAYLLVRALLARERRDRTGAFIGGAILLFLGCIFLAENYYDLDWQKIWPFFLIIPGAGLLIGALLGWGRRGDRAQPPDSWTQPTAPGQGTQPPRIDPPAGA